MDYKKLTIQNKSFIKRYSHTRRFLMAIELLEPVCDDKILDYGTGDGYLLEILSRMSSFNLVGFEPMQKMFEQLQNRFCDQTKIRIVNKLLGIQQEKFDKIVCLEVFEHLNRKYQSDILNNMKEMLKPNGRIVVSVPIEIGLGSFLKNIARLLLKQQHGNTTGVNIIKSLLGMRIQRDDEVEFIGSHIGFDYRDLENAFSTTGLKINKIICSPFPVLGKFVNSQVFYVLVKQ